MDAAHAVDMFAPNWISTTGSTPHSSVSYAGRLMSRRGESTNNNAVTALHRDENLPKKTSRKYTRIFTKKSQQSRQNYIKARDLNSTNPITKTTAAPIELIESGTPNIKWEATSCHGDTGGAFRVTQMKHESSCEAFQSPWMKQGERTGTPNKNDQEPIVDNGKNTQDLLGENKLKRKCKAVKAWRKQVDGLKCDDRGSEEQFAPTWMSRALSKSEGDDREVKHNPCTIQHEGASRPSQTPKCSSPDVSTLNVVSHDEEGPEESMTSPAFSHPGQPAIEAQMESNVGLPDKRKDTSVASANAGDVNSVSKDKPKTPREIGKQGDDCSLSLTHGASDARPQTLPEVLSASFERQLDEFVVCVLLAAVVSVLVEEVVEASLGEVGDEIISTAELKTAYRTPGQHAKRESQKEPDANGQDGDRRNFEQQVTPTSPEHLILPDNEIPSAFILSIDNTHYPPTVDISTDNTPAYCEGSRGTSQQVEFPSEINLYDELTAAVKLSDWPSDDDSFQSDVSSTTANQSCLDDNAHGSPAAGTTESTEEPVLASETPPWASADNVLSEESLINACLQQDARENGYAASVAVLDAGEEEGLLTDVRLLWISDESIFPKTGDCGHSPGSDDVDDGHCDDKEGYTDDDVFKAFLAASSGEYELITDVPPPWESRESLYLSDDSLAETARQRVEQWLHINYGVGDNDNSGDISCTGGEEGDL